MSRLLLATFALFSLNAAFAADSTIGNDDQKIYLSGNRDVYVQVDETEEYQTTCYDEVPDGTTQICTPIYETRCTKVPYECHQEETSESCETVEKTKTISYSCTQTRTITRDVFDHTVYTNVEIIKDESHKNFDLNECSLSLNIGNFSDSLTANCGNAIIRAEEVESSENSEHQRTSKFKLKFSEIENIKGMMKGISAIAYNKGILSFNSADLSTAKNIALNMKLIKNRFLLKDKTIFNGTINQNAIKAEKISDDLFKVWIKLKDFISFDDSKKHTLVLNLKTISPFDISGKIINQGYLTNSITDSIIINK